ncbi:LPXTG cell wall anchor domain-containing protein, partial [Lactobacillus rhamnosus]|nr:LPXTG cell wall anchor domain-containing protein [Lacticaseibacillus rhamnosus]
PDKTDLNDTIAKANGLKESDYTAESWTALVKAREAAQAVADNDKATAYDVALALTNLESAIAGLEKTGEEPGPGPVEVNKTDLQTAVNKASKLEKADYTTNSWEAFAEALKAAQQVLDNKNATQQDVDTALSALQDAISKLEATAEPKPNPEPGVVDKAALNATINKAAAINLGLYTDDSANALRAALKKAREVSDNSNATQKQVDAAREALEKAIAGLVKRTAAKGDGNVVSNTGANVVTIAVAGLLLAGAGAAIAYRRNREQM